MKMKNLCNECEYVFGSDEVPIAKPDMVKCPECGNVQEEDRGILEFKRSKEARG